ncbi:hypothetical protein K439DRAFT_1524670 [Ramaria rubella]|nr:hypothetical protein K439DRAFT_1524670 [Ramaria rubella]
MASPLSAPSSRASTPESPRADSPLARAATTINDLTLALSNFSRAPTPDPPITCCCHTPDCDATTAWAAFRAKLESRLVLSAEVGQALLQRHEAYVRRQDAALTREASLIFSDTDASDAASSSASQQVEHLTRKLDTVTEENVLMESRLTELHIKHELSEAATRTLTRELHDARAALSRLTAQHARAVGWEIRLAQQTQAREDMRQERDSEAQRARIAESKAAAFVEKCSKLQNEIHALHEEIHTVRSSRAAFSKSVLHEARTRLEALQQPPHPPHYSPHPDPYPDPETTRVLESLVADNELLKRDIAELQNMLGEAREEARSAREEVEEWRVGGSGPRDGMGTVIGGGMGTAMGVVMGGVDGVDDITRVDTPPAHSTLYSPRTPGPRGHHPATSITSLTSVHLRGHDDYEDEDAGVGAEWSGRHALILQSGQPHPHPTLERLSSSPFRLPAHPHPSPPDPAASKPTPPHPTHTPLSRPPSHPPTFLPSPRPSTLAVDRDSSHDTRSDSSSINQYQYTNQNPNTNQNQNQTPTSAQYPYQTQYQYQHDPRTAPNSTQHQPPTPTSALAPLTAHLTALLTRMTQADVRTLTNRLKRQHLLPSGGDARYLSQATVRGIVGEVAGLRPLGGAGAGGMGSGVGKDEGGGGGVGGSGISVGGGPALVVTRGDIKALLKLFKDTFTELGTLREQVNEVVFDPAVAYKIRKQVMEPAEAERERELERAGVETARPASAMGMGMGGWIAPVRKLFAGPAVGSSSSDVHAGGTGAGAGAGAGKQTAAELGRGRPGAGARPAPKLAPAISASSTTVNVEFASSGVRGTETSGGALRAFSLSAADALPSPPVPVPVSVRGAGAPALRKPVPLPHSSSRNLMSIFAGAPQSVLNPTPSSERWVVLPRVGRTQAGQVRGGDLDLNARMDSRGGGGGGSGGTLGRSATMRSAHRLSRNVDAVIDQHQHQHQQDEQLVPDFREALLERALRPRALSDSSIRSTFLKAEVGALDGAPEKYAEGNGGLLPVGVPTASSSSSTDASRPSTPPPKTLDRGFAGVERARSPAARLGRNLASWATAAAGRHFEDAGEIPFGSPREEGDLGHVAWTRRGLEGREV